MTEAAAPESGAPEQAFIEAEPAQPIAASGRVSRRDRARGDGYRKRFAVVYVVLALVAGIAGGVFVVLVTRPDPAPPAKWSSWQPSGSDISEVRQIADRVAKRYRFDGGKQLVAALPSAPKVSGSAGDVPVSVIAIRPDTSTGKKEEDQVDIVPTTNSIQYLLCGLGENCSIVGGTASTARHALLRREALELALYTFKYVASVDSVSVFLPPRPDGEAAGTSVFLKRTDVSRELAKPLAATLGPKTPAIGSIPRHELATVNRITEPRLYSYEYQQAQDGSALLILDPVILGA